MRTITVHYDNGDTVTTNINGSNDEIAAYYLGNTFNLGLGPDDNLAKAIQVTFEDGTSRKFEPRNPNACKVWAPRADDLQEGFEPQ